MTTLLVSLALARLSLPPIPCGELLNRYPLYHDVLRNAAHPLIFALD